MRWLFTSTLLISAFLLFLIQPMIAKMILPGAPGKRAWADDFSSLLGERKGR